MAVKACLGISIQGDGLAIEKKSLLELEENSILGGAIMVLYNPAKNSFWVLGDADRPAPNQQAKFEQNILKGIPDENPNKDILTNALKAIVKKNPATFTFRDNGTTIKMIHCFQKFN